MSDVYPRSSLNSSPDKVMTFEKGKLEIAIFTDSGVTIGRPTFEPGWRLEKGGKPLVKTNSCQVHHTSCIILGKRKVLMDDVHKLKAGPDLLQ